MQARDVMVSPVITVRASATVRHVASILLKHRISAVPVVDDGKVIGVVTESDLLHRTEAGTERSLFLVAGAPDRRRTNGVRLREVARGQGK
ncbi:CBS domain-containing protein [Bradyrhizobium elkanii]